ncbi:hypothetical protein A1O7_08936 [Cladophialophora yegresii CBS 114405]|uniref:Glycosyltransferase 2 n=1 Tax=Cladophialophora yegresii CBS 114405 TaxID=1182544 RepID=W9VSL9_9EURO|nr:uncharacterized protein A1O7_08936 [Cladophialophora yegresii CBS 114405]EXJ56005.1 hypothetical protein A1O7_08936 [Cladophialophora yegresii CBS 114405]
MAARSRFHPEGKDHDRPESFTLRRSNTYNLLVGRWKSFRRRRIILVLLLGWLLYLFFKHMPTDLPPVSERYDRRYGRLGGGAPDAHESESQTPPQAGDVYEGPIKFYALAGTVEPHTWIQDPRANVLFAVSDLKSVPQLLPIACSMGQHNKTRVHLAFMGRQGASWKEIRELNGITESACDVYLHDARPDYASLSSAARLEVSARASLGHIHSALRLHAVILASSDEEHFLNAIRDKTSSLDLSLIDMPTGGWQSLSWISALDSASLSQFNKIQIDIVIQAQQDSSASLMRLLRSVKDADYTGWTLPRLTVELPNNVDSFVARYLANFRWPADGTASESRLIVRHRLDARLMSPVQASMRTIESFYPQAPRTTHVLLLSPDVELSPNYFQFLMYSVLEYKYGAGNPNLTKHMMGISLELPPVGPDLKTKAPYGSHLAEPCVLWQAPTSNAALFFGDRWIELHTFLSYRLLLDPELGQKTPSSPSLSHKFPSWLQPVLEMMQVRGYYMMYPTFMLREGSSALTVHRELAQSPEEFMMDEGTVKSDSKPTKVDLAGDRTLTADEEIALLMKAEHRAFPASLVTPFVEAVSGKGVRSAQSAIPLLSFHGEQRDWTYTSTIARKAAEEFAVSVGGCKEYDSDAKDDSITSLFCLQAS